MESRSGKAGPRDGELSGGAKTLVKAMRLLRLVAGKPAGLSLSEISRSSDLPKPTVHRVLGVLVEEGLLRVDRDGGYRVGAECLVLGTAFLESLDLRYEAADVLRELVEKTGETCHLGVLDGNRIVYIEKFESPHAVRMHSRVGATNPAYSTGLGKAILAYCPPEVIEAVIAEGLVPRTDRTITEPDALRAELAAIRERGYAVDDVENEEGIRCVAGAVFDHRGHVVAGVSVAAPEYRMTADRIAELGTLVGNAVQRVSARMGFDERRTAVRSPT